MAFCALFNTNTEHLHKVEFSGTKIVKIFILQNFIFLIALMLLGTTLNIYDVIEVLRRGFFVIFY